MAVIDQEVAFLAPLDTPDVEALLVDCEQVLLDFSVLPENATNKAVTFTNDYDIVDIRQETETSPVIIVAKKAGEDELTVISDDNGQATLTYYINPNRSLD